MLKYMYIFFIYKAADYRICFENNIDMEAYFIFKDINDNIYTVPI